MQAGQAAAKLWRSGTVRGLCHRRMGGIDPRQKRWHEYRYLGCAAGDSGLPAGSSAGNGIYLPTFEEIRAWLDENAAPGDIVITLGSGDVYIQTKKLL